MTSRLARFLGLAVVFAACSGAADKAADDTTPPPQSGGPATTTVEAAEPAAGGEAGLAALDIEMDEGNDGVGALIGASVRAGCKVQRKEQDGHPSLISECPGGLFGAVQVGNTLSIRCVDMALDACELFVLSILDAAGDPASEDAKPSGGPRGK